MKPEYFKIIKEINSLEGKLHSFRNLKIEDQKRIQRLYDQKDFKKEDLTDFIAQKESSLKECFQIDRRTMEIDKEIENINSQLNSIFDEKTIAKLVTNKEALNHELATIQEKGLELLEENESLEEDIKSAQTFLMGIDETIDEIYLEVFEEAKIKQVSQDAVIERIDQITQDLSEKFKNSYLKAKEQTPKTNPLSHIMQSRCQQCQFELPSNLISDVEDKFLIKTCVMCKRILIPQSSAY